VPARPILLAAVLLVAAASQTARASAQAARLQLTTPSLLQHAAPLHLKDVLPRSAEDKRLAGWILVGAGLVHLALTPVCLSELHGHGAEAVCVGGTAVLGSAAIVVGAVLLVQGYEHGPRHAPGRKPHAARPPPFALALASGRALISYRVQW
jgi:hypothetical protein